VNRAVAVSVDLAELGYTAVAVAAAAVTGGIAVVRRPGERVTSGLQHFAAGAVFAAAAIELIPKVLQQDPTIAIIGFATGIAVMFRSPSSISSWVFRCPPLLALTFSVVSLRRSRARSPAR
jgi:zinc transporter ZupT